jgi:hypothetical protein
MSQSHQLILTLLLIAVTVVVAAVVVVFLHWRVRVQQRRIIFPDFRVFIMGGTALE